MPESITVLGFDQIWYLAGPKPYLYRIFEIKIHVLKTKSHIYIGKNLVIWGILPTRPIFTSWFQKKNVVFQNLMKNLILEISSQDAELFIEKVEKKQKF